MNVKKHKKPRRKYDQEFKLEVLKMLESGQSVTHISRSLGIGENLIYRWKKQQDQLGQNHSFQLSEENSEHHVQKILAENEALKKQLKRVEMEREILKKAISIFSQTE
ncbi:transposase [Xanthocytophaga flava]|uniref:transposase n=1 Tax=Xanthocytophaga flava TaxID=3048013 RepID=UPI0028D293B4|nr:transposase [Xanthocytophaga flavus]MDJ1470862.1 transposase [Xanthocytophaga flavus]